jgi:protocatechuate 3,4-dioxygenase beta subunit
MNRQKSDDNNATVPTRRRRRWITHSLVAALVAGVVVSTGPATPVSAGLGELQLGDKIVDKATAQPGDTVIYTIPWTCFSNFVVDCAGALIEDPVPTYTDVFGEVREYAVTATTNSAGWSNAITGTFPNRTIVWTADATVLAGETGAMTFVIEVPRGLLPPGGVTISNTATARNDATDLSPTPTNTVTTTVSTNPPSANVRKTNNATEILLGDDTTYTVSVCPVAGASHFPSGYVVTDTVPVGAVIVSASNGGIVDNGSSPATVEWTMTDANDPGFDAGTACFNRTVVVTYPAGAFPVGTDVTNSATATPGPTAAEPNPAPLPGVPNGGPNPCDGCDTDTIRAAVPNMNFSKDTNAGFYVEDEDALTYSIYLENRSADGSDGETEIKDLVILDGALPVGFELTTVNSGTWNGGNNATVEISTAGAAGPWTTLGTSNGSSNAAYGVAAAAGNPAGVNRFVRWTFAGTQPVDFTFSASLVGTVESDPLLPLPAPGATPSGIDLVNDAAANANGVTAVGDVPLTRSDNAVNRIETPQPDAITSKTVSDGSLEPGESATFTLSAGNGGDATGDLVVSAAVPATLTDCFPSELTIDAITLNGWVQLDPVADFNPDLACTGGRVPLAFRRAPVPSETYTPGQTLAPVLIDFHVRSLGEPGGPPAPQTVTNSLTFAHPDLFHGTFDANAQVSILLAADLASKKSISGYTGDVPPWDPEIVGPGVFHGAFDDVTKSADVPYGTALNTTADTYPGGPITYQIAVLNGGNAAMRSFSIFDTVPHIGDNGVKAVNNPRASEFPVELTGPVVLPSAAWSVAYFTDENPCRPAYGNSAGCTGPTPLPAGAPWSDVKSFEIKLDGTGSAYNPSDVAVQTDDDVFEIGEEIVIQFPARAPMFHPEFDAGGTTAFPYEGLLRPSQVDSPATSPCFDHNSAGAPPAAGDCPVSRNSFAYAGVAFGPGLATDVPLNSEPPQVEVTVYAPPANGLGDRVWFDNNANGIQDNGELGLPGATVELLMEDPSNPGSFIPALDNDGDPVAPFTTDANGNYSFFNLGDGDFKVRFTPPAGYIGTTPNADGTPNDDGISGNLDGLPNTNVDSDASSVAGQDYYETGPITLLSGAIDGEYDPTWDFGVFIPFAIGDIVWYDDDSDGRQDPGEPPVVGAVVSLLREDPANPGSFIPALDADGDPVVAQTTGADGRYLFDFLLPGNYRVAFDHNQADYVWTNPDSAGVNEAEDSDPTFAASSDEVATTATIALGLFQPQVRAVSGADDATYAAVWPSGVRASFIQPAVDAGIYRPLAVGDYVWYDDNRDGIQGLAEAVVPGVTVDLLREDPANPGTFIAATDADANPVPSVVTDGNGKYVFDNLLAGTYRVQFSNLPSGYAPTVQSSAGSTSSNDSNPELTGLTPSFMLTAGASNVRAVDVVVDGALTATRIDPTIDMGIWRPYAVGNFVWFDDDRDGIQDAAEAPVQGVRVELLQEDRANSGSYIAAVDINGDPIPATSTDADGFYVFDNLESGRYRVQFTAPDAYIISPASATGSGAANDSNPNPATGLTPPFDIGLGAPNMRPTIPADGPINATSINPTIDMGIWQRYAVGDYTWIDSDADGVQDAGEVPIAGITVALLDPSGASVLDADGVPVAPTVTDAAGHYVFDNLVASDYRVAFTNIPAGYQLTGQSTPTSTSSNDSNPATSGSFAGITPVFTLGPASVDGRVPITADGTTDATWINPTIDAGMFARVAVGNYTWIDVDLDGVQDAGEPVLAGVTVALLDANGNPAVDADGAALVAQVTDASGRYLFDNLLPGSYQVQFTLPAGYAFTTTGGGTAGDDSNADRTTGRTAVFTVVSQAVGNVVVDTDPATVASFVDATIDAGVVPLVAIGNYTWIDSNLNGLQDPNEAPLPGVRVSLRLPNGSPAVRADGSEVATVVTDSSGAYLFDGLLPGEYQVAFVLPPGYGFTTQGSSDGANDSNPASATGVTPTFTVAASATGNTTSDTDPGTVASFINATIDAGVIAFVSVGNKTWSDTNANGIQDPGEAPIGGVTVQLLDANGNPAVDGRGNPVPSVQTDQNGMYLFDGLLPGDYRIRFTAPSGFKLTGSGAGPSGDDSNPDPATGLTPVFTLTPSTSGDNRPVTPGDNVPIASFINPTIDAGFTTTGLLPRTGQTIIQILLVALAMTMLGIMLVNAKRRRVNART